MRIYLIVLNIRLGGALNCEVICNVLAYNLCLIINENFSAQMDKFVFAFYWNWNIYFINNISKLFSVFETQRADCKYK